MIYELFWFVFMYQEKEYFTVYEFLRSLCSFMINWPQGIDSLLLDSAVHSGVLISISHETAETLTHRSRSSPSSPNHVEAFIAQ
jgi:hypothetical protein